MKPILYEAAETAFETNGIGVLGDCCSCIVTEQRNGIFELEMTYPMDGIHFSDLSLRRILLAQPNPTDRAQPFRIYEISRPIGGVVTVYAQHISYDLSGVPVSPFTAASGAEAMAAMKAHAVTECPFTLWTDVSVTAQMIVSAPDSIRALLGGQKGSLLDCYGGEYAFDRYAVKLHGERGEDRGVSIRYGKNLTDLRQEENCANVYTGVYPYWLGMDGALVQLEEKLLYASGSYDFTRILPLNLSEEWQEAPTQAQLRARARRYMENNQIGVPRVSLEISFVQLADTEEYKSLQLLERVGLCDTVYVEFPALGVSARAKCVKTVYDVLLERFRSLELGSARSSLQSTVVRKEELQRVRGTISTELARAVQGATGQITGNKGGYVVLHSSTGAKEPDEILIMDKPAVEQAARIWRWNQAGLGYSSTGYNGSYGLAMTQDGAIVADFMTTGTLTASLIKAGVLTDGEGKNYWNMETGEFSLNQADAVNSITNGGSARGIVLKDGKLYIDASFINSGNLSSENVDVLGALKIYTQTGGGSVTPGVVGQTPESDSWEKDAFCGEMGAMRGAADGTWTDGVGLSDSTGSNYVIVTSAGVRMQAGNACVYAVTNGDVFVEGNLHVTGGVYGANVP